jgi:hypothetical protein
LRNTPEAAAIFFVKELKSAALSAVKLLFPFEIYGKTLSKTVNFPHRFWYYPIRTASSAKI